MNGTTTTKAKPGVFSDFFGQVKGVASDYMKSLGTDVLPNWTKSQLKTQQKDQLQQPTFIQETAPPRVESISGYVQPILPVPQPVSSQQPVFFDENYQAPVTQSSNKMGLFIAIGIAAIFGLILLVKK